VGSGRNTEAEDGRSIVEEKKGAAGQRAPLRGRKTMKPRQSG